MTKKVEEKLKFHFFSITLLTFVIANIHPKILSSFLILELFRLLFLLHLNWPQGCTISSYRISLQNIRWQWFNIWFLLCIKCLSRIIFVSTFDAQHETSIQISNLYWKSFLSFASKKKHLPFFRYELYSNP